jgi:O-antigen ligase
MVIGRLYVGELVLACAAFGTPLLWADLRRAGEHQRLGRLITFGAAYMVALVLTDLYRGTPFHDYARGWFRALLFFGDVLGLQVLTWQRWDRLLAWVGGRSLAQLAYVAVAGQLTLVNWKFGAALPVTVLILILLDARKPLKTYGALLSLAAIHLVLDFRSLAAFMLATVLLVGVKRRRAMGLRGLGGLGPVLVTGSAAVVFAFVYVSNVGLMRTGEELVTRRVASNVQRFAGLAAGVEAISMSPVVGWGSWPRNDELFLSWVELQADLGSALSVEELTETAEERGESGLINTHSQLLQGWVEAGLVGGLFFLFLFGSVVAALVKCLQRPRWVSGDVFCIVWAVATLWSLLLSPFSGLVRLDNALALSLWMAGGGGGGLRGSEGEPQRSAGAGSERLVASSRISGAVGGGRA